MKSPWILLSLQDPLLQATPCPASSLPRSCGSGQLPCHAVHTLGQCILTSHSQVDLAGVGILPEIGSELKDQYRLGLRNLRKHWRRSHSDRARNHKTVPRTDQWNLPAEIRGDSHLHPSGRGRPSLQWSGRVRSLATRLTNQELPEGLIGRGELLANPKRESYRNR